jgi:signal transduction histidine kinase
MYEIIDKLLLFLCCLTFYLFQTGSSYIVIPIIVSVILSSLFLYYDNFRIRLAGNLLYAFLCLLIPEFIIFLPLLLYDLLHTKYQHILILIPFLYYYHIDEYSAVDFAFISVLILISYILKFKTDKLNLLITEYNELRDSSAAMSLLLEKKNQTLLLNQDYEINLATLNERNRISKEIHDNVGHLLSRALLQVGALLTIIKDEPSKEGLSSLKNSLSEGMDQIRSSIHNLYDESID